MLQNLYGGKYANNINNQYVSLKSTVRVRVNPTGKLYPIFYNTIIFENICIYTICYSLITSVFFVYKATYIFNLISQSRFN